MSERAKVCFIGAGFHATTNIYPCVVEMGAEIVAVATRSKERSQACLQRFGSTGTAYDDYHKMLQNEVCDGVIVIAQAKDQFMLVRECIKAGKNVFVDKPLGWNEVEANELAVAAESAGVVLMVGFMKRYSPIYRQLKDIIDSNYLGRVYTFEAKFACNSTRFCPTEEEVVKYVAIHLLDLFRFLFGEATHISGFHSIDGPNVSQALTFRFSNGAIGTASFVGVTAHSKESESVNVTFERGHVTATDVTTLKVHKASDFNESNGPGWRVLAEQDTVYTPSLSTMSGCYADLYLRGFVGEIKHFLECCQDRSLTPSSNGRDNVGTMALCDRVLAALNP